MKTFSLGLIAGFVWFYILAQLPLRPWFALIIVVACAIWALAASRHEDRNVRRFTSAFAAISIIVTVAAIYFSMLVMDRAKATASGRPYCIQVASASDYSPAQTLLDFSPITMHAATTSGLSMTHHAILVVQETSGTQLFHWSYHKRQFVPGTINSGTPGYGPAIVCEPEKNFARHLPTLIAASADDVFIRFSNNEAYRIPLSYHPRWSGGANRYLTFQAAAPDLTPSLDGERQARAIFVSWKSAWLMELMKARPEGKFETQENAYGLTNPIVISDDKSLSQQSRYFNLAEAAGGENPTMIDCYSSAVSMRARADSCHHRFMNAGRHIDFRHSMNDLPQWRNMQEKLIALLASFEASAAAPNPPSSRP